MLHLIRLVAPYLMAILLGGVLGIAATATLFGRHLAFEKAAHERDNAQHVKEMKMISDSAFSAEMKAQEESDAAKRRLEVLDYQLTQEIKAHEIDDRHYRDAIVSGAERVRVAVTHCAARSDYLPNTTGSADVGDGATAYANLNPTLARRLVEVARADQHEIDKLRALQGYVCAIRPDTEGCRSVLDP